VEEQNRFISDASHELRTPLAALKTSTEVALRDRKMSASEARQILEDNLEDIGSLEMLSEHLLRLAQYQKGRRVLEFEKVNLGDSAKRIYKKIQAIADKKKIDLELKISDIYINADLISIEELMLIFMDNALKYTPEGGRVSLSVVGEGKNAVMKVSDSGEGINRKDIPHIFDRFYRVDRSRSKSRISGFGLGLPVAKRIVELHHGSINVSSKPGSGSTFTARFPLA